MIKIIEPDKQKKKLKTTITVNPLTLKWANTIRGLYQYKGGVSVSLDETIFFVCSYQDWLNARYKDSTTDLNYTDYVKERVTSFLVDFTDDERSELYKIFQEFQKKAERLRMFEGVLGKPREKE